MDTENFKARQKRLEKQYRRAGERAQSRLLAAFTGALSQTNTAILERFERRVVTIDTAIEEMYQKVDDALRLQGVSDAVPSESGLTPDKPPVFEGKIAPSFASLTPPVGVQPQILVPPENPLCGLSVRTLHKLEKMDSHLRHSVVEVCLNNLKMFAQLAPAKSEDDRFVEKVLRCIPAYPAAVSEIAVMFERRLDDDTTLRILFPGEYDLLSRNLSEIDVILKAAGERKPDQSFWRRFVGRIPGLIDAVLGALGMVTAAITGVRVPVLPILRAAVDLFRPHSESKGIVVNVYDKTDKPPVIFADRQALLNTFVELLRNAHKHAFDEAADDKKIEMSVSYPDRDRRRVHIDVCDNGVGIPREILPKLGRRGVSTTGSGEGLAMVESVIRRDHMGDIKVKSKPGRGTTVHIALPVKLDL